LDGQVCIKFYVVSPICIDKMAKNTGISAKKF
jgi:hypothetical protein